MANGIDKRSLRRLIAKTAKIFSAQEVAEAWQLSMGKRLSAEFVDRQYTAVPYHVWEQILQDSNVSNRKYVSERSDCDDFAYALRGTVPLNLNVNGIGVVLDISGRHAYNAVLSMSGEALYIAFVEPQTDQFVTLGDGMYKAEVGSVRF